MAGTQSRPGPTQTRWLVMSPFDMRCPARSSAPLLHLGFNDSFEVRSADGQRTVLRLSSRRARGEADVQAETAFIAYLDQASIPVAAPVQAKDGTLFGTAQLPEGPRPSVLFHYAEGRAPQWDLAADARANGVTLARIHRAAGGYTDLNGGRYRLDLDHLLHRPLSALLCVRSLDLCRKRRFHRISIPVVVGRRRPERSNVDPLPWRLPRVQCLHP